MAEHNVKSIYPRISDRIGDILEINWAAEFGEILVFGYQGIAVLTASGELVATRSLHSKAKLIGHQRTYQGWQLLVSVGSELRILSISTDGSRDVVLNGMESEPHTARWSPSGLLLAVGSVGTALCVWNTDTGLPHWKRTIDWDTDEFLTPPTLSVHGWTPDGKRIVTTAEYLAARACNVWDSDSGELLIFID